MKTIFTLNAKSAAKCSQKAFCLVALLCFASFTAFAQVGIGITSPDPTAQLDITASGKGLLIPRMDKDVRDGISLPATGLLIYQQNETPGFYYYDGSSWKLISTGSASTLIGFSGIIGSLAVSSSTTFTNYSTASPYYNSAGFNPTNGTFTVPQTGNYSITATINFQMVSAASVSLGSGVNPTFQVVRTSPVSTTLISGLLPILNVNVALVLTLRTVLGNGAVTLSGNALLNAGDVIQLTYAADGLTQAMNIVSEVGPGVIWSVTKL